MDTGIHLNNPDLNIWVNGGEWPGTWNEDDDGNGYVDDLWGWNFYQGNNDVGTASNPNLVSGHSTACAGIAAAKTNNSIGVAGICWGAEVMILKVWEGEAMASLANVALAFDYARIMGADIISCTWITSGDGQAAVQDAIIAAKTGGRGGKGCVVVFAGPNNPNCTVDYWPTNLKTVIVVGGTDYLDKRWDLRPYGSQVGSSYGFALDLVAPADRILTTSVIWRDDPYNDLYPVYDQAWSGTCMSCSEVSGAAGLLVAQDPNLTACQIQAILEFSAQDRPSSPVDPLDGIGRDLYFGYGRLNVKAALDLAMEPRTQTNASNGLHKASFFHVGGHLVVEDIVKAYATTSELTAVSTDLWVVRNNATPTPEVVARLTSAGTLYLKGNWAERQTYLTPPSGSPLVVRDNSAAAVAYIDLSGNLKVKGRIFMGNDPDRQSSQAK